MDLHRLQSALGLFALLDPTHFPAHFAQVFLVICRNEPCTFRTVEEALSLSNSAVSRTVAKLGATDRKGQSGFGLVTVERDPEEGRRFLILLTSRGHALKRQLEAI